MTSKSEASDFEIVPTESRDDADMWNVEDENADQANQAHIQSAALDFELDQN